MNNRAFLLTLAFLGLWAAIAPPAAAQPVGFVLEWGNPFGSGDGQLLLPTRVAVDSSGNVYVADFGNNRVQKFDGSGTFLTNWGSPGSGNGEFDESLDVAVDDSGNVYVLDRLNCRVQKFDDSGTFLTLFGSCFGSGEGSLNSPLGLAVDDAGNVYVADGNSRIQVFDSSGAFVLMWGWGVADGSAALQTCAGNCQAGIPGAGDGQFSTPAGVAVDSSGNVYVTDANSRIQKFDSSGNFLAKWGSNGSGDAQFDGFFLDVAVDDAGNVYVADNDNGRIQKFDSSGTFVAAWGWGVVDGSDELQTCTAGCLPAVAGDSAVGAIPQPFGVAVGALGEIYVAEFLTSRIIKFGDAGAVSEVPILGSGMLMILAVLLLVSVVFITVWRRS